MRPISVMLANALLEHHEDVCVRHLHRPPSIDPCLIAYGELCRSAGCPGLEHSIAPFLAEIAEWCDANSWPPINALAVNATSRRPGDGYDAAAGCSLTAWHDEVIACIVFTGYPASV